MHIGFRQFVYSQVGYKPTRQVDDPWRAFHDRVSLTYKAAPVGYFSIFRESAELMVVMGENGVPLNESILPDISVGKTWSAYWVNNKLADKFGDWLEYTHYYPPYFPQAVSNPQTPWCYPDEALSLFRRWFNSEYINGGKLKSYLDRQVKVNAVASDTANLTLAAYGQSPIAVDQDRRNRLAAKKQ